MAERKIDDRPNSPERIKLYRQYIIKLKSMGITEDMLSQKM